LRNPSAPTPAHAAARIEPPRPARGRNAGTVRLRSIRAARLACVSAPVANGALGNDNCKAQIDESGEHMCVAGCEERVWAALSRRSFFTGAAASGFAAAAVPARAAETRSFTKVVDLTHTMSPEFPTFMGKPGIEMEREFDFKKDRFNLFWWHIVEHAGTHLDAPFHFSETGLSAEKLSVEQLVIPLAVVNVVYQAEQDADYQLSGEDLAKWESKHGRLPAGCCVALHSGWGELATTDPATFIGRDVDGTLHFPGFAPEAAAWLLKEREVAGIAVDTMSLDHGPSREFKTHQLWLPSGRWGLENVANLDKVPEAGATLVVGASKVKDSTGGLARVIALV
jgi:kynurenine formamidase